MPSRRGAVSGPWLDPGVEGGPDSAGLLFPHSVLLMWRRSGMKLLGKEDQTLGRFRSPTNGCVRSWKSLSRPSLESIGLCISASLVTRRRARSLLAQHMGACDQTLGGCVRSSLGTSDRHLSTRGIKPTVGIRWPRLNTGDMWRAPSHRTLERRIRSPRVMCPVIPSFT
jgi:hypothetical protein